MRDDYGGILESNKNITFVLKFSDTSEDLLCRDSQNHYWISIFQEDLTYPRGLLYLYCQKLLHTPF